MKKLTALLLALCLCTLLFAACGDGNSETTPGPVTPEQTTLPTGPDSTVPTETTGTVTPPATTPDEPRIINSPNYNFIVRTIVEDGKTIGVAACDWKALSADTTSISFSSKYLIEDTEYPVLKIGIGVGVITFQTRVESITIEAGIPEIADNAFTFCSALKTLKLNDGLEKIGKMAFWNCGSLETLVIPSTVTEIGEYAFADCASLKSVTLPRSFEGKTDDIFAGSKNVTFTFVD